MPFVCDIPAVPTLMQEDDTARVTRWDFAPGAVTGFHRHAWPYFVVMLVAGTLRAMVDDVETDTTLTAGQTYGRPAGIEHDVMNASAHPIAFVEIEIKRPDRLVMAQ